MRLRVLLYPRSGPARTGRNPSDVTQCDATATHSITLHSACATSRKIHISFARGRRALCNGKPRSREGPFTSEDAGTRATATCRNPETTVQLECSLYRFPFCSLSHFSTLILSVPSSLSLSLFCPFSPLANMAKIALFLYNAHIRRSYCNLVRSRFRVIGEEKYFHGCGAPTRKRWSLSFSFSRKSSSKRKSRAAINLLLKRNRSPPF